MSIQTEPPVDAPRADALSAPVAVAPHAVRSITIGGRVIPVIGPNLRDPRLHLALVIVSVITIGTTLLDFRLSIPQIVIPVLVCALVEATYLLITAGALMWPASGMQTATSTVLVLRVVGVERGDWWTFEGLHWFVGVAVFGLLTKYFVRTRAGHVFNPSNVALVLAFLIIGAHQIEPLDYWWGPLDWRLALAYSVIIVGGVVICGRLGLLRMALAFWTTLAIGVGVLAALGHSMTTRWSFAPVEGWHLWRTIVLSPETMIFLFFMITDPKTTPRGRVARVAFGVGVGVVSTLLLAPWPTEFGSKVGLLSGLAVLSVGRLMFGRFSPAAGSVRDRVTVFPRHLRPIALATGVFVVILFGAAAAGAGAPNRAVDRVAVDEASVAATAESITVDRATDASLPEIVVAPDVAGLSHELATPAGAEALARALLFNLEVEAEAVTTGNADLLTAVDHGQRLLDLTQQAETARNSVRSVSTYAFDTIHLGVVFPGGFQSGPNAGLTVTGTVTETTIGADGVPRGAVERPLDTMFTLRRTPNGTWLTTGTLPPA